MKVESHQCGPRDIFLVTSEVFVTSKARYRSIKTSTKPDSLDGTTGDERSVARGSNDNAVFVAAIYVQLEQSFSKKFLILSMRIMESVTYARRDAAFQDLNLDKDGGDNNLTHGTDVEQEESLGTPGFAFSMKNAQGFRNIRWGHWKGLRRPES